MTGSSAGAYGAIMGAVYLKEMVYPTARFDVLGDAGNGVVTQQFLTDNIKNWGVEANLPHWIKALDKPIPELSIDQLWSASARQYASDRFAQYTSAYDGGLGSQSFFYNVMVHITDLSAWLSWWNVTCDWNTRMRALAQATAPPLPTTATTSGRARGTPSGAATRCTRTRPARSRRSRAGSTTCWPITKAG